MKNTLMMPRNFALTILYLAAATHMLVALGLLMLADSPWLQPYHQQILPAFFSTEVAAQGLQLQIWWMRLFAATLECLSLWMAALIWLGARYRNAGVWLMLLLGLLLWAPQDILISLQAGVWAHVWVDLCVLALMLPPLLTLFLMDRKRNDPNLKTAAL